MSQLTAIKIENVSKLYRLGLIGSTTLKDDLKRFWWKITGKGDPFLKIGQENQLDAKGENYVWALRDINLEIKQGEVVGIIGKNGAGKSTLLKILSRVTLPTTGEIKIRGRIGSLLEVGTGFHPELTGRENIYLNGSILGMTKQEIRKKFDDIVDFAGVAKYIDTPVKRYSSGMYVRLGFAVAAFLEPEILVVDEVLAVGDIEFQKRAIGKMQDVSKTEGRTVLFVSHNMASIRQLCNRVIVLEKGKIKFDGETDFGIAHYINKQIKDDKKITFEDDKNKIVQFKELEIISVKENKVKVKIIYEVKQDTGFVCAIKLSTIYNEDILTTIDVDTQKIDFRKTKGIYKVEVELPIYFLKEGKYFLTFSLSDMKSQRFDYKENILTFEKKSKNVIPIAPQRRGFIYLPLDWNYQKIEK